MGSLEIRQHVALAQHSTMRLGGAAAYLAEVHSVDEVRQAVAWAEARGLPLMMIGDGSNIVWRDEGFGGLILVNKIAGFQEQPQGKYAVVTVGAGENWDSVVARTVAGGLSGVESLSLIPGTVGATPVQNVGAYGQEISQTLQTVEVYDLKSKQLATIQGKDCAFGYRTSRFKAADRGRFLILGITLRLRRANPAPPFYNALQTYLDEHDIHNYTPDAIRQAVIAIRTSKLPDPALVANNGSFFANPVIGAEDLVRLQATYDNVPHWPTKDGRAKISAAWLLEQAGFKNYHDPETGMATWPAQPLVLVNEHARRTAQLLAFKQKIVHAVHQKFGISLEQEPELLP